MDKGDGKADNPWRSLATDLTDLGIATAHAAIACRPSDFCDQHQTRVAQFYQWQKYLFENADAAFERAT